MAIRHPRWLLPPAPHLLARFSRDPPPARWRTGLCPTTAQRHPPHRHTHPCGQYHSRLPQGCILVGYADRDYKTMGRSGEARLLSSRKALNELREYLLNYQKEYPNEEIYVEITEPDAYPLYNVPYERQLQKP